jgi:hypothetical protein
LATGDLTIENSTLSGNSANGVGGAIRSTPAFLGHQTINRHSTLTGNDSGSQGGGFSTGGGTTTISHSLFTDNTSPTGSENSRNGGTVILDDFNLFGDDSVTTTQALNGVTAGANDILATSNSANPTAVSSILDTTFADNGGLTPTHALVPGSIAINSGDSGAMAGVNPIPLFDQRGSGFDRVASSSIDIGAFELQSLNLVVDTLDDESDGDYSDGDLSLREALELANAFAGADTITFDGSLAGGEIDLSLGELTATDGLSLIRPGVDQLTIDAQRGSRVMRLSGTSTIDMSGLTLTGGTADQGGGLRIDANVTATLTDVSIQGNTATASGAAGGGVFNNGDLTLRDSSVTGNMATNASNALGGGL